MKTKGMEVRKAFREGRFDASSDLTEVPRIGTYLARRLNSEFDGARTVEQLWDATALMNGIELKERLYRALQNDRGNQCVASRSRTNASRYHTPDVNEFGYEAAVALIKLRRQNITGLPARLPSRGAASRRCACKATCDGPCTLSEDGQLCVPKATGARGFVGVAPLPDQVVPGGPLNRRVRTRITAAMRSDPDSSRDIRSGHRRSVKYSRSRGRSWRHPGTKIRS